MTPSLKSESETIPIAIAKPNRAGRPIKKSNPSEEPEITTEEQVVPLKPKVKKSEEEKKEIQRQNAKKTYAKNTEKLKEQKLAYKKEHLETVQAKQRERYQRIKEEQKLDRLIKRVLSNDFTPEQRQAIVSALIPNNNAIEKSNSNSSQNESTP